LAYHESGKNKCNFGGVGGGGYGCWNDVKSLGTHISTEVREIEVTKIPSYGISSFVDMELSALSEFIIRIRIQILGAEMDNLYLESTTVNY
jgi:hypothetical protein